MADTLVPDFRDEVQNIVSGVAGIVDATYNINGIDYLDVQVDKRMYYMTPRSNWKVTSKCDE